MKILIIGAVAAGTSAAAKARRNNDFAEIVVYEKDRHISYSGCGLPYYIGNDVTDMDELTPRDPEFFKKKYNVDIKTGHEVLKIDKENKELLVVDYDSGETFIDSYDALIIATGAKSFVPDIAGNNKEHVFTLRNVQSALDIKTFLDSKNPKEIVIVGSGFIGLELLENLVCSEYKVTIIEKLPTLTPNLDSEMAIYLENQLQKKGIKIITGNYVTEIKKESVILADGRSLPADMVVLATGIIPETKLAKDAGVETGETGAIKVNKKMQTNLSGIFACGDCIETFSVITGKPVYHPLGSTANKTGRIAGDVVTGGELEYKGNLGTGIYRVFDLTVAATGLTERQALQEGYEIIVNHNTKPDRPAYFRGEEMIIKVVADKKNKRILGVQIIGGRGSDKRLDIFVTLITCKATVDELFHLDLAYAPPFSTTKDPVHYSGMILDNAINRERRLIRAEEIRQDRDNLQIIDTRSKEDYESKGFVEGAIHIPHQEIRNRLSELDPNKKTVTYCNKGTTGNAVQNILLQNGFTKVYNLSGGHSFYKESFKKEENDTL